VPLLAPSPSETFRKLSALVVKRRLVQQLQSIVPKANVSLQKEEQQQQHQQLRRLSAGAISTTKTSTDKTQTISETQPVFVPSTLLATPVTQSRRLAANRLFAIAT